MRLQHLLPNRFRAGLYKRLRYFSSGLARKLYLSLWFPHVPLAIAVGFSGILQLTPAIEYIVALELPRTEGFRGIPREAIRLLLEGLPRGLVGLVLLAMAVGLLGRSRLAWTITLILTAATVLTELRHQTASAFSFYNGVLLFFLVLSYRHFDRSSLTAGTLFAIISVALLLGYAVFGSYLMGEGFSPPIDDLVAAFYFAIVSMSTVGYGDIVPTTPEAQLFVMSTVLLGITVFATSISAIIVPILSNRMQRLVQPQGEKMERKNHYIIIGNTFLAYNTYQELHKRNFPVTLVLSRLPEAMEFPEADMLVGDVSNLEILRKAGVECAQAVLALGEGDSDNAFLVLAVKELGSSAKTVVAVNNTKNLGRVRRVQPDLIIAPEVLGGELLAMALSGENPDSETLIGRLLYKP
jgi:voltage-gated potassium channel